jgi:2-oxoisovalerate dehydrogenase E1 component alpha subunit
MNSVRISNWLSKLKPMRYSTSVSFPGAPTSSYCETMQFSRDWPIIPTYRVLDVKGFNANTGNVIDVAQDPKIDEGTLTKMYETMITLNTMDPILYEAQRQGRISFYMTSFGEEATHMVQLPNSGLSCSIVAR